jgi:hypothetical protein
MLGMPYLLAVSVTYGFTKVDTQNGFPLLLYSETALFFSRVFPILSFVYIGQAQILFTIFWAEFVSECADVHYTKGGPLPTIVFPPVSFTGGMDEATLKKKQDSELNNGRLAMIAIMSFCAAANIPGSVPLLVGNPMF